MYEFSSSDEELVYRYLSLNKIFYELAQTRLGAAQVPNGVAWQANDDV